MSSQREGLSFCWKQYQGFAAIVKTWCKQTTCDHDRVKNSLCLYVCQAWLCWREGWQAIDLHHLQLPSLVGQLDRCRRQLRSSGALWLRPWPIRGTTCQHLGPLAKLISFPNPCLALRKFYRESVSLVRGRQPILGKQRDPISLGRWFADRQLPEDHVSCVRAASQICSGQRGGRSGYREPFGSAAFSSSSLASEFYGVGGQ